MDILHVTNTGFFFKKGALDNFKDQKEFYYVSADANDTRGEKWWIPTVKVPPNGLSEVIRKWIQVQKDSVNQVLKAAMAINAQILSEMEIPEDYIESLPKVKTEEREEEYLNRDASLLSPLTFFSFFFLW